MARSNRGFSRVTGVFIAIFVVIFFIGFGFLIGFRFILHQTARYEAFDAAIAASSAQQTGGAATAATETGGADGSPAPGDASGTAGTAPAVVSINAETPGAIMIYIELGDKPADIARQLKSKGVIRNPSLFTILSKINGFDGSYRYGTHFVKADMSYDEIMYLLSRDPATISVTFREGMTYNEMKAEMKAKGIRIDETKLDDMVNDVDRFREYRFVEALPADENREHTLQGYLFPDTYFYDINTDEETIIRRFLNNTEVQLLAEHYQRAEAIGMTMDQVITLASIIQMESSELGDMYLVSRVLHNRLNNGDLLQSCATVNYLRKERGKQPILIVGAEDLEMDSPYNTYLHAGLPPGPICSPGLEAIRAALYPDVDNRDIYYFVAKGDGTNYFTNSLSAHEAAIEEYLVPLQEAAESEASEAAESDGSDPEA